MAPSSSHISAPPPDLGAMTYGAETCYLGAVGHGAEKKVQSRFYVAQGVNVIFYKKGPNCKRFVKTSICDFTRNRVYLITFC